MKQAMIQVIEIIYPNKIETETQERGELELALGQGEKELQQAKIETDLEHRDQQPLDQEIGRIQQPLKGSFLFQKGTGLTGTKQEGKEQIEG